MDSRDLETFLCVARSGSFSLAAEQLFLSQPAVSKRIAGLEQELNNRLFDRIGRQIILTRAGELLLHRAPNIMTEIQNCLHDISSLSGKVQGPLSIATSHHIGLHHLPSVLRYFTQKYPGVQLDLHFMDSDTACRKVENGQVEMAIITLPKQLDSPLKAQTFQKDPLSFVVGKAHPLATLKQKNIGLKDIAEHAGILPLSNTTTRLLVDEVFRKARCKYTTHMDTNFLETIKMLVSVGLGWSILPRTLLDRDLIELKVERFSLHRHLGILWHEGRTLSNAANTMIATLLPNKNI